MVRTHIQLTDKQAEILKKKAREQKTTVAAIIRGAIERMIIMERNIPDEKQKRRAITAAGKFTTGLKNLARQHDNYLDESYR